MHIVYFLTYGYSLKTWQDSGNLDRELKTKPLFTQVKFSFVITNLKRSYFDMNATLHLWDILVNNTVATLRAFT